MTYLHWILLAVYAIVTAATMVAVLVDDRQPVKALAWLLVLLFLPVVGVVVYFFFGQNARHERIISKQSLDKLTRRSMWAFARQSELRLPERYRELIHLLARDGGALPYKDNEASILTSGSEFVMELLAAIGRARHHIHLTTYIINDDALGNLVADALIDKARGGVAVRLIYDDVGSWKTPKDFFERMRDAGIDAHAFMPVKFPAFTSRINYRNHRKVCIIDGREGFVGGMNIALRYVKGTRQLGAWRDTHLHLKGSAVHGLQTAFLIDWYFVDRTLINDKDYYPTAAHTSNDCLAQIVTSDPTNRYPEMEQAYVKILAEAKRYVYMATPYFLPTEPVLFAMRMAAQAGIDVRLMIPYHADSKIVEWASRSFVATIEEAGVKVLLYKGGFNHSKLLVSDDSLASCGSTNIDFRSFNNNFEVNAFFYDSAIAQQMKQVFMADAQQCIPLAEAPTLLRRPLLQHIWEGFVRLFAPLL